MKIFGKKLEDFYKWVKCTELVILEDIDVKEDPVRPELTLEWRKEYGRQIYGLKYVSLRYFNAAGYDVDKQVVGKEKRTHVFFVVVSSLYPA